MLFSSEFIANLKKNPVVGCLQVCAITFERTNNQVNGWQDSDYQNLTEGYAVVSTMIESGMLHIQAEAPLLRGKTVDDSNAIKQFLTKVARHCKELQSQQRLEQLKATVRNTMGLTGQYEFEGAEIKRIAELAHQMQTTLQSCTALEPKFRQRLQTRLEKFTAELSPGMDNIDLFWGLLGEARVLVARIGDDSRHFVGWLTEMSEIMGQVQSRSEGLPAIRESHRFDLMRLGGRAA